jgi:hypothetical protein
MLRRFRPPVRPTFEPRVEYRQQFPHTGGKRHLLGFSRRMNVRLPSHTSSEAIVFPFEVSAKPWSAHPDPFSFPPQTPLVERAHIGKTPGHLISRLRRRERKEGSADAQTLRWTRLAQESRMSLLLHHPYRVSALRETIGP